MRNTVEILGVKVDKVGMAEAVEVFKKLMEADGLSRIVTPNPEIILSAQNDEKIKDVLNSADLAIPDGVSILKAAKKLGQPIKERVTGVDFTFEALKYLAECGKSAYFLGAKPGIAEAAAKNISEQIPGLKIAGFGDGYFKKEEESSVIEQINSSGADFLCLALGAPKQELFAFEHAGELCCKAAIGVGGAFDVWSGTLKRAPLFYQKLGIEWLYRLIQEPARIKRMIRIPMFLMKVK